MPVKRDGLTISSDGKTVRSTGHIGSYENPLYIVSVQISELRMKSARKSMYDKSKDIEDYVQDEASRKSMDRESRIEKSRNRIDTPISQMTWMASQ